jgi:galactokinase
VSRPAGTLQDRLAQAGVPAGDRAGRAALVDRAVAAFAQEHGRPPAWCWLVPGRIEVVGKHTDYAGGRSAVAAVPRGFALVAGPRGDGRVTAYDARWDARTDVGPSSDERIFRGWANYVAVVARRFAANFPGAPLGTDIVFASDLPRAAGLSSSSALVVGVAAALARAGRLNERPEWRAALPSPLDVAGYLGAVENGLTYGALPSTSGVGTHGGSEDHTAILSCRADCVSAFSYVPVRAQGVREMPAGWRFVVMASGIEADKAGSAKARYNRASLATQALAALWRRRTGGDQGTLAAILADPERAAALARLAGTEAEGDFEPAELSRRLEHFRAEDARVPAVLEAFGRADASALGDLTLASQRDAETLLGNQIPQTIALAGLARDHGAFAACSFGAGFGGSVWALADAHGADAFAARWKAAYLAATPGLADVAAFVARPGPPLVEIALSEW